MTDTEFIIEPLKGTHEVLAKVVQARFEEIAPITNPKSEVSLRQAGNYCIAHLTPYLPSAVYLAVKSNIIQTLTGELNEPHCFL